MPSKHTLILYVADAPASARFYERLLGRPPVESSPAFAMFALSDALALGLWSRETVAPTPQGQPGSTELCIALPSDVEVDAFHARWKQLGITVAQAPTHLEFGYTTVAVDPDGHRLRAFHPAG